MFILRSYNQNGTGSFFHHIFGCAADDDFLEGGYSLGPQNDQVGAPFASPLDDLNKGSSAGHLGGERQTFQGRLRRCDQSFHGGVRPAYDLGAHFRRDGRLRFDGMKKVK